MHNGVSKPEVVIYTLPLCSDCRAAKEFLQSRGVPFREGDVARMAGAAEAMLCTNGAHRSTPTICVGGEVLVEPDPGTLAAALCSGGWL